MTVLAAVVAHFILGWVWLLSMVVRYGRPKGLDDEPGNVPVAMLLIVIAWPAAVVYTTVAAAYTFAALVGEHRKTGAKVSRPPLRFYWKLLLLAGGIVVPVAYCVGLVWWLR